jgi:hypothetical protein
MSRLDRGIPQGEPSPTELLNDHLGKLHVPTLDSLTQLHGIDSSEFTSYFGDEIRQTLGNIEDRSFAFGDEWFRRFNFLYQSWVATRENPAALPGLSDTLQSYDSFINSYGRDLSIPQRSAFNFWTNFFTERVVHPKRILKLYPPTSETYDITQRGIYERHGIWHPIPSDSKESLFVEEGVIKEICELSSVLDQSEADLFHATGSAALDGISQHKALLSAGESEARGNPIKTGEYLHRSKDGEIPVGGTNGLEDLYGSSLMDAGYATIRWFNEFPVVFGFRADEIEEYLRSQNMRRINVKGTSGNGHLLGKSTPLSFVRAIYTLRPYMESLTTWANSNLIDRPVISIEAATLLRTRSDRSTTIYPDYPYRFDEPEIADWNAFLQKPGIDLS